MNSQIFKDSLFGLNLILTQDKIQSLEYNLMNGITLVGQLFLDTQKKSNPVLRCLNIGYGKYPLLWLVWGQEDQYTPHHDITRPKMRVVQVYLKNCSWHVEGYTRQKSGVWSSENCNNKWHKVRGVDGEVFEKVYSGFKWGNDTMFEARSLVMKN